MQPVRRAVIDVGTNSVKLLVADVAGPEVAPVWEGSKQTRLGQSFYQSHRLQSASILNTADAVAQFSTQAKGLHSTSVRVIATSAARDALNATELISAIQLASGLKTEIISGDQEADWAFRGVTTNPLLRQAPLLLLDVGGGSTEFILGCGEERHFCKSFPMGTVRLLEKLPHSDPPTIEELAAYRRWLKDFLQERVRPELEPALAREKLRVPAGGKIELIGTGGTAGVLGSMELELQQFDRKRLESARLTRDRLHSHVTRLWGLRLEERRKIVGLPPNRADVILAGVIIYEAAMEHFEFDELRVTTRGLRFAALMEPS